MEQVVKRAKSSVDPRKYATQKDWEVQSKKAKDSHAIPKAKRITLADEMFKEKKWLPGPPAYDNSGVKQKVQGFYGTTELKFSILESTAYEKKHIPGPIAYESRGKSMSELLKDKAKKYLYEFKPEKKDKRYASGVRVKKTDDPAPTSYKWHVAKEKSSVMRATIKNTIPKAKNDFLSKCLYTMS